MRKLIFLFSCLIPFLNFGQDSIEVYTFDDFMQQVINHHPITIKAELLRENAVGVNQMAKGGFDPKVSGGWDQKSFQEKDYFSLASGALKVPTWYGIELKTGYNRNSGEFLNDSDFLPNNGLWNAGISIPLGKGLIIDNRRAALRKAKIFSQATEQERVIVLNELIYDASLAYLEWQIAEENLNIAVEGLAIAQQRFEGTKSSFINGDKPAIDTLESLIAIQSRASDKLKADQEFTNRRIMLNNFLWLNGEVPLEIQNNIRPEPIEIERWNPEIKRLSINQPELIASHPELLIYDFKQKDLEIDRRLLREELKPDVRLAYNPLLVANNAGLPQGFNAGDYKFGATFNYPILQRKSRGKLKVTSVKIKETQLDQSIKSQNIKVELDVLMNNQRQFVDQYTVMTASINNYERLLQAENTKFQIGESSVFLLNSRESKFLNSQYKGIDLQKKIIKNRFSYLFYIGNIYATITESISNN